MEEMISPFSTGSEAADWYSDNCENCSRAYFPKEEGNWPSDKTMRHYCSIGKECKMKYHLDLAFITGEMPKDLAAKMGYGTGRYGDMPESCLMFSDNEDDGYSPSKRPKPEDPKQMVLPFLVDSIIGKQELQTV